MISYISIPEGFFGWYALAYTKEINFYKNGLLILLMSATPEKYSNYSTPISFVEKKIHHLILHLILTLMLIQVM